MHILNAPILSLLNLGGQGARNFEQLNLSFVQIFPSKL